MIAMATRGSRRTLRSFCRPLAELKITKSPSRSHHTGVTCGWPSGISVPRLAKARLLNRSRYLSGIGMSPPLLELRPQHYRTAQEVVEARLGDRRLPRRLASSEFYEDELCRVLARVCEFEIRPARKDF